MTEDNRSVDIGRDVKESVIIPGNSNTATITITNYYYHKETKETVESTGSGDDKLPCPYRGLFHFGPDDAEFFFGREVFIEELFKATQNRNFIPLLGASGSGKSSVVLAGLVPKLQQEGNWLFTHFRPGSDPFHALALALVPLYTKNLNETEKIIQARQLSTSLGNGEIPLGDVFAQIHQNNPTHKVLLIADQFEEIYALCADNKVRHRFLDALLASFPSSSAQSQYNHVLVATMRADFLGNALLYRPFGDVLKNDIKLSSMNHDELKSVISKPAEKLAMTFESGLVERMLDDVEDEPGNLPLLEFALTQLWKQLQGKLLTHAGYQAIGKVQGALARHADWNYGNLSATEKERVRRIFIQLVQPGEGTLDTRRLATKAELGEKSWELVKQLADKRLVVTNQNAANQQTVEVVHEALISNWGELRRWMNENRSFRAWQERLRLDMERWHKMQLDKELLLRGKVLAEAEEKLKQRREDLSKGEKEFIQASVALRQRRQQRIYLSLGVLGSSVLLALGFWGWLNYIPSGQLTQIRWRLANASEKIKDPEFQSKAAIAFAKNENFEQAIKSTDKISDSRYKAEALSAIATAYGKLNKLQNAQELLKKATDSADKIESSHWKAPALIAIAEAYGKLNKLQNAQDLLKQATDSAYKIKSDYKAEALIAIAEIYGKLNKLQKAQELLKQATDFADKDSIFKAPALIALAEAIGKLNKLQNAQELLKQATDSTDKIESSHLKADVLSAIATAYGKLNKLQNAQELLKQATDSANIESSVYKAYDLSVIAEAYVKLNNLQNAQQLLKQATDSADKIESPYKAHALTAIARAYGKLNKLQNAQQLLKQATDVADKIELSHNKAQALSNIVVTAANQKRWGLALKATNECPSDDCEVESLARVLTVHAEQKNPELKSEFRW